MADPKQKAADPKAADTDASEDGAPKKKSKLLLILIIVGVVLLGGGGAGAFFWLKSRDAAKTATHKEEKKAETPAIFVPLEPPFVVNFQAEQSVRFLQVAVQLMTHEAETAELLKQRDPIVKNDLLLLFGGQKSDDLSTRAGKEKLQHDALEAVREIISKAGGKPESVEAIYFTSFVMQ